MLRLRGKNFRELRRAGPKVDCVGAPSLQRKLSGGTSLEIQKGFNFPACTAAQSPFYG